MFYFFLNLQNNYYVILILYYSMKRKQIRFVLLSWKQSYIHIYNFLKYSRSVKINKFVLFYFLSNYSDREDNQHIAN